MMTDAYLKQDREVRETSDQTVYFRATFHYQWDIAYFSFKTLEEMLDKFRKEKRKRKKSERALSGQYHLALTKHGHEQSKIDPDFAKRHQDLYNNHNI